MMIALLLGFALTVHAIDNLHCEISLTDRAYRVTEDTAVRLEPNQIVIRGPLVVEVDEESRTATWSIRDARGADHIFGRPADALHSLRDGDRVFLFREGSEGELLREGYFGEVAREYYVPWNHRRVGLTRTPMLFATPDQSRPVFAHGSFCEAFAEGRAAVAIKTCAPVELQTLRDRLTPLIVAYEEHRNDPSRFANVGEGVPPYERRVFERAVEGRLHPDFVDDRYRREGVRLSAMNGAIYRLILTLENPTEVMPLRAGDRIFLVDAKGEQILDYAVREIPIGLTVPPKLKTDRDLVASLGRARRALVVRRLDP